MPANTSSNNPVHSHPGSTQGDEKNSTDNGKRRNPNAPATLPWRLAATSFVIPGTVAENCRYLDSRTRETGLTFFETESCLAYDENDLPPELADLDMAWHVHLPLDLPWHLGPDKSWGKIKGLMDKTTYLKPWAYVLHPPPDPDMLDDLADWLATTGLPPENLLLENIEGCDLTGMWPRIQKLGLGVCLDLGHILAYGQDEIFNLPGLKSRVGMLHVYSPGPGARHESLAKLDDKGKETLKKMLNLLTPGKTVTLEVFDGEALSASRSALEAWAAEWGFCR